MNHTDDTKKTGAPEAGADLPDGALVGAAGGVTETHGEGEEDRRIIRYPQKGMG
ncbi:MAG: hypothetical protein IK082_06620 [Oscillospiraceae bacterium]|nr:hypothetical protein [Oscillospiraceae bacterium]